LFNKVTTEFKAIMKELQTTFLFLHIKIRPPVQAVIELIDFREHQNTDSSGSIMTRLRDE